MKVLSYMSVLVSSSYQDKHYNFQAKGKMDRKDKELYREPNPLLKASFLSKLTFRYELYVNSHLFI